MDAVVAPLTNAFVKEYWRVCDTITIARQRDPILDRCMGPARAPMYRTAWEAVSYGRTLTKAERRYLQRHRRSWRRWLSGKTPRTVGQYRLHAGLTRALEPDPHEPRSAAPRRVSTARESHRGRRGHARRQRATSGAPPGDDDGPPSKPPRLTLARKPGAIYTYGVQARERWGLA